MGEVREEAVAQSWEGDPSLAALKFPVTIAMV